MTVLYQVNSDERLFNRFREMKHKLTILSTYFQNPKQTLTHDEFIRFGQLYTEYKKEIDDLFYECESKIERIEEEEDTYEQKMNELRREYYSKFTEPLPKVDT